MRSLNKNKGHMVKKSIKNLLPVSRKWLFCLLAAFFMLTFLTGDTSVVNYLKLHQQNKELSTQVALEEGKIDSLHVEIDALNNDLDRIAIEARKLGLGNEDEVIINLRNE